MTRSAAAHQERLGTTQARHSALRAALARARRPLALAALWAFAVLAANLIAQQLGPASATVDIGDAHDHLAVAGFHQPERDASGTSYRWSRGDAALTLRGPASAGPATVTLSLGGLPGGAEATRALTLALDARPWLSLDTTGQKRHYALLLPPGALADGRVSLAMRSATTVPQSDQRPLGVRLDAATIAWGATGWQLPSVPAVLAQIGIGLAWAGLARRLRISRGAAWAVAGALLVGMAAYAALDPGLASMWYARLLGGGLALVAVTWGAQQALPRAAPGEAERFTRALLLISLAALAIRLLAVLYPLFSSHDLYINGRWLRMVQLGELAIIDRPYEFDRRLIAISPAAYILALPATLIGERGVMLQAFYALIDGLTPLLLGLLARRLGLGARASLLAAGLIAVLPIHLTALYWGFARQIVGQWLTLLLMVILAGDTPRGRLAWAAATTLIVVNLLLHPSTLLLGGVALALYLLAGLWPHLRAAVARRAAPAGEDLAYWRGWSLALLAAAALALALQYADHARLMLEATRTVSASPSGPIAARLPQIWVGLNASYAPLPLAIVAAGLLALLWRTAGRARLLAGAWFASAALFLMVDIVTGQQVRYGYFSAPLACAGVAALLEPVLGRPVGRALAWGLLALVVASGLALWAMAIFGGVKPSLNPLTH